MRETLVEFMTSELNEAKIQAALQDTYGDHWKLEEFLVENLNFLRGVIARGRRNARREAKRARRAYHTAAFNAKLYGGDYDWGSSARMYAGWAANETAEADALSAIRDEMRAGLRYMRAEFKRHTDEMARVCAEIRAERGEEGRAA